MKSEAYSEPNKDDNYTGQKSLLFNHLIGGCQLYLKMRQLKVLSNIPVLIAVGWTWWISYLKDAISETQPPPRHQSVVHCEKIDLWAQMIVKLYNKVYFISSILCFLFFCYCLIVCLVFFHLFTYRTIMLVLTISQML